MRPRSEGRTRRRARHCRASPRLPRCRFPLARQVADHLDHPDEGGGPVHDGGGSSKDLDPLDVLQDQRRHLRVEGSPPGNAIHDQEVGLELPEPPHLGDRGGRTAVPPGATSTPATSASAVRRSVTPRSRKSLPVMMVIDCEIWSGSAGYFVVVTSTRSPAVGAGSGVWVSPRARRPHRCRTERGRSRW